MKSDEKLIPIRDVHRFDERALGEYLQNKLEGYAGPLIVRQFEGGQSNPTFLISCGGKKYVLRKKPPGKLLPSAHQVEREYRVMQALEKTNVPVPEMLLLCEDDAVIGTPFFIMAYVHGRVLADFTLPNKSPQERRAIYLDLVRVLAA